MINAETDARIAADAVLQSQITDEEAARIDGDAALQSQIDNIPFGAVQVYDNDGQYLGFLTDIDPVVYARAKIYIPSLEKFIVIDLQDGTIKWNDGWTYSGKPFFKTSDCTGQAYFWTSYPIGHGAFEYFIEVDTSRPDPHFYSITGPIAEEYTATFLDGGVCTPADSPARPVAPGYEVTLPFTTPVALPLNFE